MSAKETKWTSLELRTDPTFLQTLISKYDTGPINLPGLSRYGPQAPVVQRLRDKAIHRINHYPADSVVCFVDTYPVDSVIQPLNNRGQVLNRVLNVW